jgi:hypothetical protein
MIAGRPDTQACTPICVVILMFAKEEQKALANAA